MIGYIRMKNSKYDLVDHFVLDTADEVQLLPTVNTSGKAPYSNMEKAPIGSDAVVGNESGPLKVFILFSSGWKEVS